MLLATIPAGGAAAGMLRFVRRHPLVLLSSNTPELIVRDCMARLQDESSLALFDLLRLDWRPPLAPLPVLVLAADPDGFLTAAEAELTARAYETRVEYFQGMGHDLMLEPGWEKVADRIEHWVREITSRPASSLRAG